MLQQFIEQLTTNANTVQFGETIKLIDTLYDYSPTRFTNGNTHNAAGTNAGSCKILSFGLINQLSVEHTLHCFGDYYRKDVLEHPAADDHQNIRQFIKQGWQGVRFEQEALSLKV